MKSHIYLAKKRNITEHMSAVALHRLSIIYFKSICFILSFIFYVIGEANEYPNENPTIAENTNKAFVFGQPIREANLAALQPTTHSLETNWTQKQMRIIAASNGVLESHENRSSEYTSRSPFAVPVLTKEEAQKANNEAINALNKNRSSEFASRSPFAVPVLTKEEAQKANIEAINWSKEKEREEKLRRFFEKTVIAFGAAFLGNNILLFKIMFSLIPLFVILGILIIRRKHLNNRTKVFLSKQRQIFTLSSTLLCFWGILIFVPWNVYFGNQTQFTFIVSDFLYESLLCLSVLTFYMSLVLLIVPPKISFYLTAFISSLGLCFYLQAMFMNCYLSQMDGVEPDWAQHQLWETINIIVWGIVILVPPIVTSFFRNHREKIISISNLAVLSLEIIATVSLLFTASSTAWQRKKVCFADGTNQFQLSTQKNIVVFIFDALGSGYLDYCFKEVPQTKEALKDFIFYHDARSNYANTLPGLCHELTGSYMHPAKNIKEMLNQSWRSESAKSFYDQIKKAGFDARLFINSAKCSGVVGDPNVLQEFFSNFGDVDVTYQVDKNKLHHCLAQISFFSASPYLIKKYFVYDSSTFTDVVLEKKAASKERNDAYIDQRPNKFFEKMMNSGITVDSNNSVLSFYYTLGAHPQWFLNEKCERLDSPYDDPLPTIRGCLYLLSEFIQLLKDNHIYDNTAILVCSDHGSLGNKHNTPFDMSFMIKPFNHNTPSMILDNARIQSIDILPTLLQLAKGSDADYSAFKGFPATNIPSDRKRYVYEFVLNPKIPAINEDYGTRLPHRFNSFKEYYFDDVGSFTQSKKTMFLRNIPLNSDAIVDEKFLIEY